MCCTIETRMQALLFIINLCSILNRIIQIGLQKKAYIFWYWDHTFLPSVLHKCCQNLREHKFTPAKENGKQIIPSYRKWQGHHSIVCLLHRCWRYLLWCCLLMQQDLKNLKSSSELHLKNLKAWSELHFYEPAVRYTEPDQSIAAEIRKDWLQMLVTRNK